MNIDYIRKFAIECLENNQIESDCLEYKKSQFQKDKSKRKKSRLFN